MNFYSLTKEQALIEKYIDLLYDKSNHKAEPIYDGIVDEEIYLKSIYKIIWVLKEPYDEGNKTRRWLVISKRFVKSGGNI